MSEYPTIEQTGIPADWEIGLLGDYVAKRGKGITPNKTPDQEFELYSVPSHEKGEPEIITGRKIGSNKQIVDEGTVLLCKINPRINRSWVVSTHSEYCKIASTEWITFPPSDDFEPKYLAYYLNQTIVRDYLAANASGVGGSLMRVKPTTIQNYPFLIAPLDQQNRIVAEIEKQFSRLDKAVASLKRVKANLRRYKAAVLKAAVEGKLTEKWREQNLDVEPASKLLKRILAERRTKWEEAKLAKMKTNGKEPENDKWKEKYKEPQKNNSTIADRYPKTWIVVALNQVSFVASGQTPKGITDVSGDGQIPWFKVGDMNVPGNEHLIRSAETYLSQEEVCRLRLNVHPDGTIIFPKRGGAIATNKKRVLAQESSYDLNTMGIVPCGGTNSYLWFWFETVDLASLGDGSNVPQINHGDIETLQLPLPPCDEQKEIVDRMEGLLNAWNWIQGEIELNLQRTIKLRQRILVMAFSGELLRNKSQTD